MTVDNGTLVFLPYNDSLAHIQGKIKELSYYRYSYHMGLRKQPV
jgi:hypothetical protein